MRQIFIVNATQVVTSDSHPEGLYSVISGYPKTYDSRNYPAPDGNPNGNEEKALNMARGRVPQPTGGYHHSRQPDPCHGDRDA